MDYVEKLRLAKEALESGYDKNTIEYIFPELAESKDEKIKKSLIRLVKAFYDVNFPTPEGLSRKDLLDWIEKQGEPTDILADAILDSNKDGLIADTMRHKKELVTCPICGSKIEKQSEPKPWSEEDEERYLSCLKILSTGNIEQPETINTKWLKSLKDRIQVQQEWNEENLMQLDAAIHLVSSTGHTATANWLRALKNRVLFQEKQKWSEEDERSIRDSIFYLKSARKYFEKNEFLWDAKWFNLCIEWLESLYKKVPPQPQWKPSIEQLKLLKHIMENVPLSNVDKSDVGGLYLDLKKL